MAGRGKGGRPTGVRPQVTDTIEPEDVVTDAQGEAGAEAHAATARQAEDNKAVADRAAAEKAAREAALAASQTVAAPVARTSSVPVSPDAAAGPRVLASAQALAENQEAARTASTGPASSVLDDARNAVVTATDLQEPRIHRGPPVADRDIYDNGGDRGGLRLVARKGQNIPVWYRPTGRTLA